MFDHTNIRQYNRENFIILGDPHLRYRRPTHDLDFQGIQPLDIALDAIEQALKKSWEDSNTPVYIAGDLFDRANFNHLEAARLISLFNEHPTVPVFLIRGNHDTTLVHKWGTGYPTNHILTVICESCDNVEMFQTNLPEYECHLYVPYQQEHTTKAVTGFLLYALPYMESERAFLQALEDIEEHAKVMAVRFKEQYIQPTHLRTLLITHQGIDPLVPDVTVKPEDFAFFDRVFNGHLHERAFLGTVGVKGEPAIRILGSLTYQTLADKKNREQEKGFYTIGLGTNDPGGNEALAIGETFHHYVHHPKIKSRKPGQQPPEGHFVHWLPEYAQATTEAQDDDVAVMVDDHSQDGRIGLVRAYMEAMKDAPPMALPILESMVAGLPDRELVEQIQIDFEEVHMAGFLSYVNPQVYNFASGLTYIQGLEGSGKSNIIKALMWALCGFYMNRGKKFTNPTSYGTYANKADNFRGCMVELFFTRNGERYSIVRTKKYKGEIYGETLPNGLGLVRHLDDDNEPYEWLNFDEMPGHEDIGQTLRRNTAKLLSFLGLSVEDILYTICIRPEYSDLISADQAEARKIFDAMVGAGWIDHLTKESQTLYLRNASEQATVEGKIDAATDMVERAKRSWEYAQEEHARIVSEYGVEAKRLSDTYKDKEAALEAAKKLVEAYGKGVKSLQDQAPKVADVSHIDEEVQIIDNTIERLHQIIKAKEHTLEDWDRLHGDQVLQDQNRLSAIERQDKIKNKIDLLVERRDDLLQIIERNDQQALEQDRATLTEQHTKALSEVMAYTSRVGSLTSTWKAHKEAYEYYKENAAVCGTCGQELPQEEQTRLKQEAEATFESTDADLTGAKKTLEYWGKEEKDLAAALKELNAQLVEVQTTRETYQGVLDNLRSAQEALEREGKIEAAAQKEFDRVEARIKEVLPVYRKAEELDTKPLVKNIQELEAKKEEYWDEAEAVEEQQAAFDAYQREKVQPVQNQLLEAERDVERITAEVNQTKGALDQHKAAKPGKEPSNTERLKGDIETAEARLEVEEAAMESIQSHAAGIEFIRASVLNAKGLKPYVIGRKLAAINAYARTYSAIVENQLQVQVDPKGNYLFLVDFHGEQRDGGSLSTGWTFYANMTLLGALTKERERRVHVNLLFVDEPFATVPEESQEKVGRMLEAVAGEKSLHVITHSQALDLTMARLVHVHGGIEDGVETPSYIEA